MAEHQDSSYVSQFLTNFENFEYRGHGSFGIVYKCKHSVDHSDYAVKQIRLSYNPEQRESMLKEAKSHAKLKHANIVQYHTSWLESPPLGWQNANAELSAGMEKWASEMSSSQRKEIDPLGLEEEHYLYIAMELCEKDTLMTWLKMNQNLEQKTRHARGLEIFRQICFGVKYIHKDKGMVHRDLKPSNIYISQSFDISDSGSIKIGDFGLVTKIKQGLAGEPGAGTELYMAPELRNLAPGDPLPTHKADIYSLGVILMELLIPSATGFGQERQRIFTAIKEKTYVAHFDSKVLDLLRLMLDDNPAVRPDASGLLSALEKKQPPAGRGPPRTT